MIAALALLSASTGLAAPTALTAQAHGGARPAATRIADQAAGALTAGMVTDDDGGVIAIHDRGGRVLQHAQIVLIFWGSAWTDPATSPSQADFVNALTGIIYGPWGTILAQYRGVGPLALEQVVTVSSSDPPLKFTDPEIQAMIEAQIANHALPVPSSAVDRVYAVLMPADRSSGDNPTAYGQHQVYYRSDGAAVFWAWVENDGTLTGRYSIPRAFTHEIAETCSDGDFNGIQVDTVTMINQEIGDVCDTVSTVDGAAEQAYWSEADNRCVLPRWQPFPALAGTPALIQSRFGSLGNFELLAGARSGGLIHFVRDNDNPFLYWGSPVPFGGSLGQVDDVTMIQSNYDSPGDLEAIARVGQDLQFFWRDSGPVFNWNGPSRIASGATGNPALIQSRFGARGNFELVAPAAGGGLVHFWRDNDVVNFPWRGGFPFGGSLGQVDAVTMIQSNFGDPGDLEVVARTGQDLQFFWRDSGPAFNWNGPYPIASGVGAAGNPVLIQSRFGVQGNFELVLPAAGGGLVYFSRNNDDPLLPWSTGLVFGASVGQVDAVTMIQSNLGSPGDLEVVARVGDRLYAFWRDSGPAFSWNGPFEIRLTTW